MEKWELTETSKKALLDLMKEEVKTASGRKALEYGSGVCSLASELRPDLEYLACTDRSGEALNDLRESAAKEIVVGTEVGILHRLREENPGKTFWPVDGAMVCPNMKKTTLENLRDCLRDMSPRVTVAPETALRARRAIEAMLEVK